MIDPRKIWSSAQLPTLPSVAVALLDLSRNPDVEISDFVEVIRTDPAITAKILKAANSSFFATRTQVTSLDRAVPLLGTTVVTSLALSFSLIDAAMPDGPMAESYQDYWRQSLVQAAAAETLSALVPQGSDCEYFLAGLLVDLGRLALLKTIPKEYSTVLKACHQLDRELPLAENELLGFDHVEIGSKLMENYKLPDLLIEAVRLHHAPLETLSSRPVDASTPMVNAIATASSIGDYFCQPQKAKAWERIQAFAKQFYQLEGKPLHDLLDVVRSRVSEAGQLFSVDTDAIRDPSELMAEANEQLAQLAVREHIATTQAVARNEAFEREKQELETRARSLELQAMHDPLTQIYNRRYFDDAYQREISRCCRSADPVAVIFTDIDRFKQLNDNYGHQFGDLVLKRVAIALRETLRESDSLCRYGGEEFVIVVSETTEKGIQRFAERLRARVENETIALGDEIIPVTISVGAAVCMPRRGEKDVAMRLTAAADGAMYDSKQGGRNQVHFRSLISEPDRHLMQRVGQRRFSRWLVNRQVFDVPTASRALLEVSPAAAKIGELAIREKILDAAQVQTVLDEQQRTGMRFGETAIQLGLLREEQLVCLLAQQEEEPEQLCAAIRKHRLLEETTLQTLFAEYLAERQQWLLAEVGV